MSTAAAKGFVFFSRHLWQSRQSVQIHLRRKYYVKPKKKGMKGSWQAWATLGGVTLTVAGMGVYALGKPEDEIVGLESEPDKYAHENIVKAYLLRARDTIVNFKRSFTEPSSEKLLPDHLPYPYQKPYTLIIELKDVLLHSDYDRQTGWKYQKRPGLEYFLNQLVDFYEIVIFTSEQAFSAHPLIDKMDPNHFILYRLYRDSTKYKNRHHIKDLSGINRSLNRVIIIDTDTESVKFQPENSIILDKWTGDVYDKTLEDLVPFLIFIAINEVDDVRPVMDYYKSKGGKDFLTVFRENQAKLRAEREASLSSHVKKQPGGPINTFSLGSLSNKYSSQHINTSQQPSPDEEHQDEKEEESWSVTQWIGSWVGWK